MKQLSKTKAVHAAIGQHLGNRGDMGAFKAVLDIVLEPQNPFESLAARAPRRWFVFFALLAIILIVDFGYFGNLR